jgi:hypothetical protein
MIGLVIAIASTTVGVELNAPTMARPSHREHKAQRVAGLRLGAAIEQRQRRSVCNGKGRETLHAYKSMPAAPESRTKMSS